ncbi:MAG: hypothetical protein ACC630_00860 [Nitrospinota bacterium]
MNLMRIKKGLFNGFVLSLILGAGILFTGCSKSNSVIVDKAWLDANLGGDDNNINTQGSGDPSNPPVLFIALTQDQVIPEFASDTLSVDYNASHIGKRDVSNNIIWEAVKTPWPKEDYADLQLYTMKGSAKLDWDYGNLNDDTDGTATRLAPGFLSQADPNSVAWVFEELGIVHGNPSDPRNDIDLVLYIQQLYYHDTQYLGYMYWLLELYGYPPDKIHILNGGFEKWKQDGGAAVQNSTGPALLTPGTFIPEVREDIFADKTMLQAISSGKVRGAIISVRKQPEGEAMLAGGSSTWTIEPNWFDPLRVIYYPNWGYHLPAHYNPNVAEKISIWKDSTTGCVKPNVDPKDTCLWLTDAAGNVVISSKLETFFNNNNIGKNDPIIVY